MTSAPVRQPAAVRQRQPNTARRRTRPYLLIAPLFALYAVAFLVPFTTVVMDSVVEPGQGLVADHFVRFIEGPGFWDVIARTARIAVGTTLVTLLAGYPTAAAILRLGPRARGLALMCVLSPLLMSVLARTFGWWTILGPGPVGEALGRLVLGRDVPILFTETAVIIGLASVMLPFMVLSIMSSLLAVGRDTRRAARCLGAGPLTVVRTVDVPLAMPGIVGGVLLVFALALGTYATPRVLGGYENTVVAYQVVDAVLRRNDPGLGSAIAVVLVVVALVATWLNLWLGRRFRTTSGGAGVYS